jgi:hypothetical protein
VKTNSWENHRPWISAMNKSLTELALTRRYVESFCFSDDLLILSVCGHLYWNDNTSMVFTISLKDCSYSLFAAGDKSCKLRMITNNMFLMRKPLHDKMRNGRQAQYELLFCQIKLESPPIPKLVFRLETFEVPEICMDWARLGILLVVDKCPALVSLQHFDLRVRVINIKTWNLHTHRESCVFQEKKFPIIFNCETLGRNVCVLIATDHNRFQWHIFPL